VTVLGPSAQAAAGRDHGFHALRVTRVVPETADASSLVLDVPDELSAPFAYESGQFVTFRVVIDGEPHLRCYSMSSTPGVDAELAVTIKRVPNGLVSNWLLDHLDGGEEVDVTLPAGVFCLQPGDRDVVGFAAGSGITPVYSLLKAALATSGRRVRLLYANRDEASTIFGHDLAALEAEHGDRLQVVHHLDVDHGFVDVDAVRGFLGEAGDADVYVCGPTPFMDIVESTLLTAGFPADRIHIERFAPAAPVEVAEPEPATATRVTIELRGKTDSTDHHPGTTILQTARQMGMAPPFSCESGSCATCMAQVVEGECTMFVNNALTDDEVADGWILTCQSVPTTPTVHVIYEGA
jgi:3-ketosteroid 9alpha-monooxygenase subunit B